MRIPKVRHKKLEDLGKNLYRCEDARATQNPKFEGSSGGGGYEYFGYEKQKEYTSTVQKDCKKLQKRLRRNSAQGNIRSSAGTTIEATQNAK